MCVCMSAPEGLITSHLKDMRIRQFYDPSVSLRGLSNTAHPAKEDYGNTVRATEGLPGSTNKLECFNYKGEWANA